MNLFRAPAPKQLDDSGRGRAANDAVVHDHEALAANYGGQRVVLVSRAELAQPLCRLDEGASHVAVFDKPFAERDSGASGVSDGGGGSRVRHADDEIGVNGVFVRQLFAHPRAVGVHEASVYHAVGTREVDVFEDAARAPSSVPPLHRPHPARVYQNRLARLHVPHQLRAHVVERAGFGRYHPTVSEPSHAQRADAQRVADSKQRVFGEDCERVRAFEPSHEIGNAPFPVGRRSVRQRAGDDFGVGGAVEAESVPLQLPAQLDGVYDVAVVRQRELHARPARHDGLGVHDAVGSRRGVSRMGDGDVSGQIAQIVFAERLAD